MRMKPSFHEWAADRRLKGLVLLVLALASIALIAYTYYSYKSAQYIYTGPTTISVRGEGKVTRVPDVAMFTFGVEAQASSPEAAQKKSADAINTITAYLKENGIAETDYKTIDYTVYPRYRNDVEPVPMGVGAYEMGAPMMEVMPPDYDYRENEIIGYTAVQTIEVKVRDTDTAGSLIAGVGERGATNVSGLRFTLDDSTEAKMEARAKAVEDARKQAAQLAQTLGVRLTRLSGFWEEEGYYPMDAGYGGPMMERGMAPEVSAGENTITSVVNLTYEIK